MTKTKSTKRALLMSALALLLCISMLIGSTFAWFTDSVTSGSNVIQAGRLDIVMEYWDGTEWVDAEGKVLEFRKASAGAGEEVLWEPGCTYELPKIRVRNDGNLTAYVVMRLNGVVGDEKLLEAVTLKNTVTNVPESLKTGSNGSKYKAMEGVVWNPIYGTPDGTVLADWSLAPKGEITPGTGHTDTTAEFTISGHMKEEAGNEYQDLMIQGISITVLASQEVYEYDSFGREYDKNAPLPTVEAPAVEITSEASLRAALANGKTNLKLVQDIGISATIDIEKDVVISGGKTIRRADGFTGTVLNVKNGAALTLEDVVVDGGAVWANTSSANATNSGVVATGNLIAAEANAKIILNEGAVLQNNDGAHAVNLGTRIGATLTLNGGEIIYNRSDSGAIWGGGHITINSGKINNNYSTGIGGAIRMVSNCNLTMNGGELSNNYAASDGGAIWGYGSSTYTFAGGEIANNESAGTGGAIYTGTYSKINISGDFEMYDNKAANSGAIRLTDHTSLNMTGGKIYGNTQAGASNAFNTWNNSMSITGGSISDNISYVGGLGLTIGDAEISGIISYNLSTNHNTAYLAAEFNAFKFTVNETASNFSNFNFKPASGYTYTAGDEAKLICMNEGYETYWDAATGTFRLQAK